MSPLRALQGRRKNLRLQKQLRKAVLIFDRQTNDLDFIDRPMCDLLSSGNHEIADTAALELRCALDDPERIRRDASFDTRGPASLLGHG
jgi:hypothetical protein